MQRLEAIGRGSRSLPAALGIANLQNNANELDAAEVGYRQVLALRPDQFGRIDQMVDKGLHVRGQVGPRPIGLIMSFATTVNPFYLTPTFRRVAGLSLDDRLAALKSAIEKDMT